MPRRVTLTFADGSQHVYDGVPDDATPRDVEERAAREFTGRKLVNIDGGRAAAIPGQEGEAARVAVAQAQPQPTLAQRAVGAGEAALTLGTGATGGALGMIGGTLKGLAEQILAGKFGTAEAANLVEQSAAQGAQALTYHPRTEQGQEQVAAAGQALQNLIPLAPLTGNMAPAAGAMQAARAGGAAPAAVTARAAAAGTARDVVGAVAPRAAEAAAGAADATVAASIRGAQRVGQLARESTTLPRRALEALQREPEAQRPTPGTMGSVGAAGTDMATQRRTTAEMLGFTDEAALTRGQATRDAAQLKFETEAAKIPDAGVPLRARLLAQNDRILQNFDHWVDETGARAPTLRAVGSAVDEALVKQSQADKARVRAAYTAAEKAGELESPVTLADVVQHLNDAAPESATAPLLDVARRLSLKLGIAAEGPDGILTPQPATLKAAERFRQAINRATDFEPTNVRQATIIKGLTDEATAGLGGDLYRQARKMRARFAQNYEDRAVIAKLLNNKRGMADRQVALEDVFSHTILKGSLDDVRNVRRVLQRAGDDGAQAWRELQGSTVQWLRDEATKNVATDSAGNRVISPAALDKAIRSLDADGKLDFVFGREGAQRMRDLRDLAQYVRTVPPEAAVNTSNTVSALLAAFGDAGLIGMSGAPVPVVTMTRFVRQYVKDRALRKRIEDALNDVQKRRAPGKENAPVSAPNRETQHRSSVKIREPEPLAVTNDNQSASTAATSGQRLSVDLEGRPLNEGATVFGRRVVGGVDEGARGGDAESVAARLGIPVVKRSSQELGGDAGRFSTIPGTILDPRIELSSALDATQAPKVFKHELAHAIDKFAGEIPSEGVKAELAHVYDYLNNRFGSSASPRPAKKQHTPELDRYKGGEVPREHWAEAIRLYMIDPAGMKAMAPKTAARIREYVNSNKNLSQVVQFNSIAAPAGVGLGLYLLMKSMSEDEQSES